MGKLTEILHERELVVRPEQCGVGEIFRILRFAITTDDLMPELGEGDE